MNIFVTGINYRTAPLPIRETLSFNAAEQKEALIRMSGLPQVSECVMLSTCNRTEIYIYCETKHSEEPPGPAVFENELCRSKDLPVAEYRKYFYSYQGIGAVKHLFRVTAGLDSMVMGEDQILGQVKKAHQAALAAKTSRTCLNTLFREAVTAAKLIKSEMKAACARAIIPRSVASLAVKEAQRRLGTSLAGRTALIIGTGEVGGLVLQSLTGNGLKKILLATRNKRKVTGGTVTGLPMVDSPMSDNRTNPPLWPQPVEYIDYQRRYEFLDEADFIFSATASPHYTITRDGLEEYLRTPKKRVFIDLAVPRDIDADIRDLPEALYLNLDDLAENGRADWDQNRLESIKAERIMDEHILSFERWYEFRNVLPLMQEIQYASHGYVTAKINETVSKLKSASNQDKEVVRKAMRHLANHFLNQYLYSVKENGSGEDVGRYLKCLGKSMGMGETVTDENLCSGDRSRR